VYPALGGFSSWGDVDLDRLRSQLEASRDYIFSTANIPADRRGLFNVQ
jgi:hypothetical protein